MKTFVQYSSLRIKTTNKKKSLSYGCLRFKIQVQITALQRNCGHPAHNEILPEVLSMLRIQNLNLARPEKFH